MYSYITKELLHLVESQGRLSGLKKSIMGHSMGGHGALVAFLRNPNLFTSVSAFAPICQPSAVPWGQKAFTGYLGHDKDEWKKYDATCLMSSILNKSAELVPILIDQGAEDNFLVGKVDQLKPLAFKSACQACEYPIQLNLREGYDHSYFFISTFIAEHIRFHARYLNGNS
mmetsp:Transcript_37004/g.95943  ORF Transcript_37004/g.95943 Transcript_37004/m.95943 type:complete len:171 (-) Transcript_37004:131-643(-)